ncbi:hypothetical protein [uncultured Thiodictyon sp.]|uniref:hypothetical protein n=1 Tax=uncultured Thiodictyon sp. TaxID=1846217 RepID=UPI0025E8D434|nr:hypothetical protein [uncultured Thiodictyon sp.]
MNAVVLNARITTDHRLDLRLPDFLPAGTAVKVTVEPLAPLLQGPLADDQTVTELGRELLAIRQRAIARGLPLQSADAILDEVRQGRAEAGDDQDLR